MQSARKKTSREDKKVMFIKSCLWNAFLKSWNQFSQSSKKKFLCGIYFCDLFLPRNIRGTFFLRLEPIGKYLRNLILRLVSSRKNLWKLILRFWYKISKIKPAKISSARFLPQRFLPLRCQTACIYLFIIYLFLIYLSLTTLGS